MQRCWRFSNAVVDGDIYGNCFHGAGFILRFWSCRRVHLGTIYCVQNYSVAEYRKNDLVVRCRARCKLETESRSDAEIPCTEYLRLAVSSPSPGTVAVTTGALVAVTSSASADCNFAGQSMPAFREHVKHNSNIPSVYPAASNPKAESPAMNSALPLTMNHRR